MIPPFPAFKRIDVSDRHAVEQFTAQHAPYSDFNFTSLWAWDINGKRRISQINGNLVVRFTDYHTQEPFLSFLGNHQSAHTVRTLIDYCKATGLPAELRLVPEISVDGMDSAEFAVQEDRDDFDYIYLVSSLSTLTGKKFKSRRNLINGFTKKNPEAAMKLISLNDKKFQQDMMGVVRTWEENKKKEDKKYDLAHEEMAINRLFETADSHNLTVTAIDLRGAMLAFAMYEMLPNNYCIGHFWKADTSYFGIYGFHNQKSAQYFEALGCTYFNHEQDLGIPSLRSAKELLRPVHFLKKYTVRPRDVEVMN